MPDEGFDVLVGPCVVQGSKRRAFESVDEITETTKQKALPLKKKSTETIG